LQQCLLQEWEAKCSVADQADQENLDLLLVLAFCSRTAFGGEKDLARAKKLELQAARRGSDVAAVKCLTNGLLDGFDPSITAEEQIAWLKTSLSAICIRKAPNSDRELKPEDHNRLVQFQDSLDAVLEPFSRIALFHSFIKAFMTDWEVLNGSFDGAAQDSTFCWAVNGDISKLSAALDADPRLLQHRKAGFTLLHVAVDYIQEHVVRSKMHSSSYALISAASTKTNYLKLGLTEFYSVDTGLSPLPGYRIRVRSYPGRNCRNDRQCRVSAASTLPWSKSNAAC
jgi:hypothetical protein